MKLESTEESQEIAQSALGAPKPDGKCSFNWKMVHEVEMSALEEVETLEDRVYHASLQVKVRESLFSVFLGGGGQSAFLHWNLM